MKTWSTTSPKSIPVTPCQANICRVINRYKKIIEFYLDSKEKGKVKAARRELLPVKAILTEMAYYRDIDLGKVDESEVMQEVLTKIPVDMTHPKLKKWLKNIIKHKMEELFEAAPFNFEVFKYAMDIYFEKKKNKEKAEKLARGEEIEKP